MSSSWPKARAAPAMVSADCALGPWVAAQQGQVRVAAHPEMGLTGLGFPILPRLPAEVVEIRRGPGEIVASAPDAVLWGDGLD